MDAFTLDVLPEQLAVCRLAPDAAVPFERLRGKLWSVTRTADELTLVLPETELDPAWTAVEAGWRALQVRGVLDFSLVGILARLSATLAEAGVSIFALSTYNTDYILVKADKLATAVEALSAAGHTVIIG